MKKVIKNALIKSLPVMAGYIVLGIGFGILLKKAGYGLFWSFLMSLTIYAGSMQYVAVSLLTSGASLISVALTTLISQHFSQIKPIQQSLYPTYYLNKLTKIKRKPIL